jgi:hypothetical protein
MGRGDTVCTKLSRTFERFQVDDVFTWKTLANDKKKT